MNDFERHAHKRFDCPRHNQTVFVEVIEFVCAARHPNPEDYHVDSTRWFDCSHSVECGVAKINRGVKTFPLQSQCPARQKIDKDKSLDLAENIPCS
jgi:hypothetical protein